LRRTAAANPHAWAIAVLFVVVTVSHHDDVLAAVPVATSVFSAVFGLQRHAFDRLLYSFVVAYAAWALGTRAGGVVLGAALASMVARAILVSPALLDALLETFMAALAGGLFILLFRVLGRMRRDRDELQDAIKKLRESEESFRDLFQEASDAIWTHDLQGNIIQANRATELMNGYSIQEMLGKNVADFLSEDSHALAREVKAKLLRGEPVQPRYEQHLFRKDGSEATIELTTRLIKRDGRAVGFQNIARDVTQQRQMDASRRYYLQKVLEAQEEERKRIARELHDDTAQSILLLMHQLDSVISDPRNRLPPDVADKLTWLHTLAVNVHEGLRRYAKELRPAILDDLGLVPALDWLADTLTAERDIDVTVQMSPPPCELPRETQLLLFRIAQEAIANIKRHSQATQAGLRLATCGEHLRLTVTDNGKGFRVPERLSDFANLGKLGLTGMQERAQLIRGTLTIKSEPGRGTTVLLDVPLEATTPPV